MTGRSEDFRLVHFNSDTDARPGDFVDVKITQSSAHYLIGDAIAVHRTRGGDAHAARTAPVASSPNSTALGMPKVRN
jgi:tRNA-2-methylthio-N6-dimethylallyladenosine synthase